jgi:hypothetical protein
VPWVQPWLGSATGVPAPFGLPKNAATGRPYSGINVLILWCATSERGFSGQGWITFRQIRLTSCAAAFASRQTSARSNSSSLPLSFRQPRQRNMGTRHLRLVPRVTIVTREGGDGSPARGIREPAPGAPRARPERREGDTRFASAKGLNYLFYRVEIVIIRGRRSAELRSPSFPGGTGFRMPRAAPPWPACRRAALDRRPGAGVCLRSRSGI